jgi:hypothetical protein
MATDTQEHGCNFCGDKTLCAVSEYDRPVYICQGCAEWAIDQIRTAEKEAASGSKDGKADR